ncbi:MAG: BlaI/MecI/CopY family transcriptional regulator [Chitinophagaceae bacterium]|nr:MAG: BlaI/MecI/CopY family transcriptional regulator [Chitinophagaceae bacterium]
MKELTRAEEQIMLILWDLGKGFVKEVLAQLPKPKPAYSTVSTIIRILVDKGFVGYKVYGNTYEYFPKISLEQYRETETRKLLEGYYEDSLGSLVSSFVEKKVLDIEEADKIIKLLQQFKKSQS